MIRRIYLVRYYVDIKHPCGETGHFERSCNRLHSQWIRVVGRGSIKNMELLSVRKPGTFRGGSCNWQICSQHVTADSFMSHD